MRIARHLYDQIVGHALESPWIECCGLVASRNDEAVSVHRCFNMDLLGEGEGLGAAASFTFDPEEQLAYMEQFARDGLDLGAIYHSHPGIPPVPSGIDTMYGKNLPGVQWIIVGLAHYKRREPDVWNWRIDENERIYTASLDIVSPGDAGQKGEGHEVHTDAL